MRRVLVTSLLCLGLALVSVNALAQAQVTAVLKSGERITGQLVDLGGYDYTFRINGQERRVPIANMAMIDFSGGGAQLNQALAARAGEGRHLIVMRDGQTLEGRLVDISESSDPLKLYVEVNGQRRELTSNEVAAVYTDRPSNVPAATGTGGLANAQGARTIQVPATQQWTATNITVREGETINFSASGEVRLSQNPGDVSQVPGKAGDYAVRAPIPRTLRGALIGRIGNGQPFGIGNQESIQAPASGQLYLGVNDAELNDNQGAYTVVVAPQTGAPGGRAIPRR